ncbi:MAG: hypothetical protein AAGA45_03685, partial [Verrucomicrobiota bacterium]
MKRTLVLFLMLLSSSHLMQASGAGMTPRRMVAIVESLGQNVRQQGPVVNFSYEGIPLVLIYDTGANRMRLISPIVNVRELQPGQLEKAMTANFHSTLDARYAISNQVIWAIFIHPLSDLSPELLASAVQQVAMASLTFGDEYSSGQMRFGNE